MKLSLSKIIFFLTLLCSVAFAGGIEDDSGPEEVSALTSSGPLSSSMPPAKATEQSNVKKNIILLSESFIIYPFFLLYRIFIHFESV